MSQGWGPSGPGAPPPGGAPPAGAPPGGAPPPGPVGPPGGYGLNLPPGVALPPAGYGPAPGGPGGQEPMAVASLTVGLVTMFLGWCCSLFTFIGAPIAIVLGLVSLSRIKNNPNLEGRGMAIAGIVMSGLALLLYIAMFAFGIGMSFFSSLVGP